MTKRGVLIILLLVVVPMVRAEVPRISFDAYHIDNYASLRSGQWVATTVQLTNTGDAYFERGQLSLWIPQLAVYQSAGGFQMPQGKTIERHVFAQLPRYTPRGYYAVAVMFEDEMYRNTVWTYIRVI